MSKNPFALSYDELPASLPLFPLQGAVILPGTKMPLNVFEPRYLNMVFDVLGGHRTIGMVQPHPTERYASKPELYPVGCAGRISSFSETSDGRLLIVLSGICRFRIVEEIPTTRGYRRALVDWTPFAHDFQRDQERLAERRLLESQVRIYCETHQLEVAWDILDRLHDADFVNFLATQLPDKDSEKQRLLESVDLETRAKRLMEILSPANTQTERPHGRLH
ncbi:MAG: LON peptidase substrate-binding domain-containing protein [Gammaproteobacteria bacterium]